MNTKLYNQKDLVIKEITVEEFDAIEGDHVFSDEYEKKKQSILNAFQDRKANLTKKPLWKTAVAMLAIFMVSGTVLAAGMNYLKSIYDDKDIDVKKEYIYNPFLNAEYDLPLKIETNDTENMMEFQVLQAAKGEHTIALAILMTVKSEEKLKQEDEFLWTVKVLKLVDHENMGYMESSDFYYGKQIGLEENQVIEFAEYRFDEAVDLSKVNAVELQYFNMIENADAEAQEQENETKPSYVNNEINWTFTVELKDQYKEYSFDTNVEYHSLNVQHITLSPMSILFTYEILDDGKREQWKGKRYFGANTDDIKLLMSDGGKIPLDDLNETVWTGEYMDNDMLIRTEQFEFEIPIDVEKVIGVEVDGMVMELKK